MLSTVTMIVESTGDCPIRCDWEAEIESILGFLLWAEKFHCRPAQFLLEIETANVLRWMQPSSISWHHRASPLGAVGCACTAQSFPTYPERFHIGVKHGLALKIIPCHGLVKSNISFPNCILLASSGETPNSKTPTSLVMSSRRASLISLRLHSRRSRDRNSLPRTAD